MPTATPAPTATFAARKAPESSAAGRAPGEVLRAGRQRQPALDDAAPRIGGPEAACAGEPGWYEAADVKAEQIAAAARARMLATQGKK